MRSPARRPRRLRPRNWPVRWRLAAVSAGLTLVILVLFGGDRRQPRRAAHPRRLQPRDQGRRRDPRQRRCDRRHDRSNTLIVREARPRRLRLPQRRLGAHPRRRGTQLDASPDARPNWARRSPASATSARCGSPPRDPTQRPDRPHRRLRPVRPQRAARRLDHRPALAAHRRRRVRRRPCWPASPASRSPAGRCGRSPR